MNFSVAPLSTLSGMSAICISVVQSKNCFLPLGLIYFVRVWLTAREITYNNFEISLVVFRPNIATNHAITYTYSQFVDFCIFFVVSRKGTKAIRDVCTYASQYTLINMDYYEAMSMCNQMVTTLGNNITCVLSKS